MCSPFRPETWPFKLELLPQNACLVGGSVRDRLIQRQSNYLDLDFVLPNNAIETASSLAKRYGAGFVVLDADRKIARVVFEQVTVDFAQQQGESLEADLRRRDFTINAIAYHPFSETFIDPLGGKADIATKTVRMISPENLAADPLRLMRGYRQAAQLNFTIEEKTRAAIHKLAPQLQKASIERVRSELDALLSTQAGTTQLPAILAHRLLHYCLPHFTAQSIEQIAEIDNALSQLQTTQPRYVERLKQWLKPVPAGFHRSWIKAAKVSRLLPANIKTAQTELTTLSYSRAEIQVMLCLLQVQPALNKMQHRELSRAEQFFLFKLAGEKFPAVSLLALSQGIDASRIKRLINRFLDPTDAIAHATGLITGIDIMKQLDIKPGPELGKLLKAVEQAQAEGQISTRDEALRWLRHTLGRE